MRERETERDVWCAPSHSGGGHCHPRSPGTLHPLGYKVASSSHPFSTPPFQRTDVSWTRKGKDATVWLAPQFRTRSKVHARVCSAKAKGLGEGRVAAFSLAGAVKVKGKH